MKRHRPPAIKSRADAVEEAGIVCVHALRLVEAVWSGGRAVIRDDEVLAVHQLHREAVNVRQLLKAA